MNNLKEYHFNFFDLLTDPIIVYDEETDNIIYANKSSSEIFGYTKKEFLSLKFKDVFKELDAFPNGFHINKADLRLTAKKKNNEEFDCFISISKLYKDINVAIIKFLKRSCYEIIEEEYVKSKIIENEITSILLTDLNFNILHVNKAFLKLFGFSKKEDVYKKSISNFFMNNAKYQLFLKDLKKKKNSFKELKGITKKGKIIEVSAYGKLIESEKNKPLYYSFFFNDITEFKQTQNSINIFKKFVEASGQGFRISNLDGSIVYANNTLCSLLQVNGLQDVYGKSIFDFFNHEVTNLYYNSILPTLKRDGNWTGEISLVNTKEEIIPVIDNFFFIENIDGKPEYLSEVITDIREIKRLQQQLVYSEKLRTVGFLAAGIAHEFNNILAIIKSTVQMLLYNNNKRELPTNVVNDLKLIDHHIDRGAKIVNQLTALVKSRGKQEDFYFIEEVIKEVLELQSKELEREKINVVVDIRVKEKVKIDKMMFQQILLELFRNSRDAIKPNGKGKIEIIAKNENDCFVIIFKDDGIGMSEEVIKNIFNPFFTTKGAFSKDNLGLKGIGLGLPVSLKFIEEMNGTVEVTSKPNKGTTFLIKFPLSV